MDPLQVYAIMVLCAGDVDALFHQLPAKNGNPTLPAAGTAGIAYIDSGHWAAVAQLRCDDLIINRGLNCYYGLLLRCTAAFGPFAVGDHLVAVRGTMDPIEWLNDALSAIPKSVPSVMGLVGSGFWDVYDSMTLADLNGQTIGTDTAVAIAAHVRSAAGTGPGKLFVTGHSLGAALATYLAADLEKALVGSAITLAPYFFASPHPGTPDYATGYQAQVSTYSLTNYAGDLVPKLPSLPFQALHGGGPTHDVHVIPLGAPQAPPFSPGNNHSAVAYARMLDPSNPTAQALPI